MYSCGSLLHLTCRIAKTTVRVHNKSVLLILLLSDIIFHFDSARSIPKYIKILMKNGALCWSVWIRITYHDRLYCQYQIWSESVCSEANGLLHSVAKCRLKHSFTPSMFSFSHITLNFFVFFILCLSFVPANPLNLLIPSIYFSVPSPAQNVSCSLINGNITQSYVHADELIITACTIQRLDIFGIFLSPIF